MNKIAYLGLLKNENGLACKTFNIMGHSFMSWKLYQSAYKYFKKLIDVSVMDNDLETSMYAYMSCGHSLNL